MTIIHMDTNAVISLSSNFMLASSNNAQLLADLKTAIESLAKAWREDQDPQIVIDLVEAFKKIGPIMMELEELRKKLDAEIEEWLIADDQSVEAFRNYQKYVFIQNQLGQKVRSERMGTKQCVKYFTEPDPDKTYYGKTADGRIITGTEWESDNRMGQKIDVEGDYMKWELRTGKSWDWNLVDGGIKNGKFQFDVSPGFDAFAGEYYIDGEVGGEGDVLASILHVKGGVGTGMGWGAGAHFNPEVGIDGWKVHAGLDVGAMLGVGVDINFDIALDFKDLGSKCWDGLKWLGNGAGEVLTKGGNFNPVNWFL